MRTRPIQFPRGLKQLKEFADNGMFNLVGDNTDHFQFKAMMNSTLVVSQGTLPDLLALTLVLLMLIRTGLLEHGNKNE